MNVVYTGEFLSRAGVRWRADILCDSEPQSIGELTFDADNAVEIEWPSVKKEDALCGSSATLTVVSPGDRTYVGLYTVTAGAVRLNVYRNDALYWTGALDTEFYEEPYSTARNYDVNLTFSDFGILSRKEYGLEGMQTLRQILDAALEAAGIDVPVVELISTRISADGQPMTLADLCVRSENFTDEDGEAMTYEEVLTSIFQPLGLRMVQRAGAVYVYDINALYNSGAAGNIEWDGTDAQLGTDAVYNNLKITWSPYAQTSVQTKTECWTEPYSGDQTARNLAAGRVVDGSHIWSYPTTTEGYEGWRDNTDVGFTLWTNTKGENATLGNDKVRFFKIVPQFDGQECEGVAVRWPGVQLLTDTYQKPSDLKVEDFGLKQSDIWGNLASSQTDVIFTSEKIDLPPVTTPGKLCLRLCMEMLLDPRFNPFESAARWTPDEDHIDWEAKWKTQGNYIYMPVRVRFQAANGNIYTWHNENILKYRVPRRAVAETLGEWRTDSQVKAWLCWYSSTQKGDDRKEESGTGGWKTNRTAINPHRYDFTVGLSKADDGQYIKYPDYGGAGGKLWVEVLQHGWMISDAGVELTATGIANPNGLWEKYHWLLLKLPQVEINKNTLYDHEIKGEDVEYKAVLNAEAKEDLDLNTVCGTSAEPVPTARGAYFTTEGHTQVSALTRQGRTTQAEELLIGTLFSQYAAPHTVLSGTVKMLSEGLRAYTEQNQEGKKFMLISDVQNLITDESNMKIVEISPDEYTKDE